MDQFENKTFVKKAINYQGLKVEAWAIMVLGGGLLILSGGLLVNEYFFRASAVGLIGTLILSFGSWLLGQDSVLQKFRLTMLEIQQMWYTQLAVEQLQKIAAEFDAADKARGAAYSDFEKENSADSFDNHSEYEAARQEAGHQKELEASWIIEEFRKLHGFFESIGSKLSPNIGDYRPSKAQNASDVSSDPPEEEAEPAGGCMA